MIGNLLMSAGIALGAGLLQKTRTDTMNAAHGAASTQLKDVIHAMTRGMASGLGQNYVTASKGVRVEPFVLVDPRVSRLSYIRDVMNCAQRLFTAYYMLSVSADNTINGVKVSRRLDKFAPDRDLIDATGRFLSNESYQFGLPFVGEATGFDRFNGFSPESRPTVPSLSNEADDKGGKGDGVRFSSGDIQNLAIGQIVDVTFTDGKHSGTVQVMIRLKPIGVESGSLVDIMSLGGDHNTYAARKMQMKVGGLAWTDLVTSSDRIREYRQAMLRDTSGYFRKVHGRKNKSWLATLLTGQPNIAQASSIAVVSRDTIDELENKIGGSLDNFETRQRIFDETLLMLMFVVDDDRETVTIYTQDTDEYGVYTLADIKAPNKGNNDLTDIMKAFLEGKIPGRL